MRLEGIAVVIVRALPANVDMLALKASMFGAGQVRHLSNAELGEQNGEFGMMLNTLTAFTD